MHACLVRSPKPSRNPTAVPCAFRKEAEAAQISCPRFLSLPSPSLTLHGMQNPSGNNTAPAAAAAGKSKSSAQAAAAPSAHGHQPSPATPAVAKSKSSSQAAAGAHSSPATPAASKSKSSAHAAASGQASSSHHHHIPGGAEAAASSLKRKRGVFQKDRMPFFPFLICVCSFLSVFLLRSLTYVSLLLLFLQCST
jgi:transcription initiation factor TFIID subunit 13